MPPAVEYTGITVHDEAKLVEYLAELARRRAEALALYEPLKAANEFHASRAPVRLVRGSNRAGKTLAAAAEIARAVCGFDPYKKYPERDGRVYCVGKDGDHLGQVMWRKLARAGSFKIIRDEHMQVWRAFRPWIESDAVRVKEAKPAPPLIPPRMITKIAWENKGEGIPAVVTQTNGWELSFYSSLAKPPQGADIDLVFLDEEIVDREWVPEMMARLVDRNGVLVWSATPQAGTQQLFDLHEEAEKVRSEATPRVVEFVTLISENPHLTDKQKKDFAAGLSEDDYRVRVLGEFALSSYKVYPEYSPAVHVVPWQDIPPDWTRYVVVDPGRQVLAALFAAVPPASVGDYVYLYDELYIHNADASMFGDMMARKVDGQVFEAFLIDSHSGRQTEVASGRTIEDQYTDALRAHSIRSFRTGSGFIWAPDDVISGVESVRKWLRVRENGTTKLRILSDKLPNLDWELKRYHYKRVGGILTDKPDQKHNHAVDCLRYLAMFCPKNVRPRGSKKPDNPVMKYLREKWDRKRHKEGRTYVRLG